MMSYWPYLAKMKRKVVESKIGSTIMLPPPTSLFCTSVGSLRLRQSQAFHITVSLFFTRLMRGSGVHLWECCIGLPPSVAPFSVHLLFTFAIHLPLPPPSPGLLFTSFSANTIGLHDQQHRGKCCKITGRSPPLGINHQKWLNVRDSFEQTRFGSGGLRHDIKRHIAAGAQGEAMWVK